MSGLMNKQHHALRNALFLGFCAVLLVSMKILFRWHLHIPGHSMLIVSFFLILARGVVPGKLSASTVGLWAGLMVVVLGLGKGGPLQMCKYVFPALFVDIGARLLPNWTHSLWTCALLGVGAGLGKTGANLLVDWAVGMETGVLFLHAGLKGLGAVIFSLLGSLLVPPVLTRLRAHRLL